MTDKRAQRAAEQILTDPGLTDNLDDSQANILLDWGVEVAKRTAATTAHMPDEQAAEHIALEMRHVRRVMRRINNLAGSLADGAEDEIAELVEKVRDATGEMAVARMHPIVDMPMLVNHLKSETVGDALRHLLGMVVLQGQEREEFDSETGLTRADLSDERTQPDDDELEGD